MPIIASRQYAPSANLTYEIPNVNGQAPTLGLAIKDYGSDMRANATYGLNLQVSGVPDPMASAKRIATMLNDACFVIQGPSSSVSTCPTSANDTRSMTCTNVGNVPPLYSAVGGFNNFTVNALAGVQAGFEGNLGAQCIKSNLLSVAYSEAYYLQTQQTAADAASSSSSSSSSSAAKAGKKIPLSLLGLVALSVATSVASTL